MPKKHLKRLNAPTSWPILRKAETFVTRSYPGRNQKNLSLPISLFFKNILKVANTTKEVKKMLQTEEVLVDGKRVRDIKNPVEFMDLIHLPALKATHRISLDNHGRLIHIPVKDKERHVKICRIIGKTKVKGGKIQLNLNDARNVLVEKDVYKMGDSVLLEVPSQKILQHFKLEKGAAVLLVGGKHAGQTGTLDAIEGDKISYTRDGETALTLKKYVFIIGKEKPGIAL